MLHRSSKRKKVSILVPDLSAGGMTRAYWLAKVIISLGLKAEILGQLRRGSSIYPIPPKMISVQPVQEKNLFELTKSLVKKIDGDIIYAIKPRPKSFGIALLHRLRNSRPVVLDIDDWEWSEDNQTSQRSHLWNLWNMVRIMKAPIRTLSNPNFRWYLKGMERLTPMADAVTVNNRFLQNRFGGQYVPSGKDTSLFDPNKFDPQTCRNRLNLTENFVVMFPGTPRPHKGLEDLLTALTTLHQPKLKVVIVGGRKNRFAEALIERWPERILHLPRYPLDNMPEVVAAAHVLVLAQRDTPMARAQLPMKLTDGMAMAKPILSTLVGDIPEVLGGTGYLVEPGQPDQIAKELEWIMDHQKEAILKGSEARKRCVEHYSLEAVGPLLSQVFDTVT